MYATEVWTAHPPFCQGPIGSKATNAPCRTSTQRRRRVGGAPLRVRLRLGLMRVSREHSHRAWPVACCATRAHMWDRRLWSFPGPQSQLTNTQALVHSSLIALARLGELFRRRRGSWQLHPCTLDCGCPSGNVCVSHPFRELQKKSALSGKVGVANTVTWRNPSAIALMTQRSCNTSMAISPTRIVLRTRSGESPTSATT